MAGIELAESAAERGAQVIATGVGLGLGLWFWRLLGGMAGDTFGATSEVAEVTVLVAGLALIQLTPEFAGAPFW